jgi:hypothetical protein
VRSIELALLEPGHFVAKGSRSRTMPLLAIDMPLALSQVRAEPLAMALLLRHDCVEHYCLVPHPIGLYM